MIEQRQQRVGRYLLRSLYASGGMGETFLARDGGRDDERAGRGGPERLYLVKLPAPALVGSVEARARFEREAAALRRLDHPNVQRLVEAGTHHLRPFIALEYVPGESLREVLRRRGALPATEAVAIALALAGALDYCHGRGVVHRDLKPENVVLTPDAKPVVVDFGAAFLEGARRLTYRALTGELGTPEYMAPEQVQGERGDARSDVYALGTLLYELLTGRPPFAARPGDGAVQIMRRHLEESPPPPGVPGLDPTLLGVLRRAIQRRPHDRFPTMASFGAALAGPHDAVARGEVTPGWPDQGSAGSGAAAPDPAALLESPARRERLRYAAATVVALLVLAALGLLARWLQSSPGAP